ncbi:hypothetical protein Bbelb_141940 [Branchiostoma belcheri]|nr:hypothetical protein Bbelb_141940 [Branchiostoma belcheri]
MNRETRVRFRVVPGTCLDMRPDVVPLGKALYTTFLTPPRCEWRCTGGPADEAMSAAGNGTETFRVFLKYTRVTSPKLATRYVIGQRWVTSRNSNRLTRDSGSFM